MGQVRRALPWWWWPALAAGAAVRVYFVCFTEGSFDVLIKARHGSMISELGLLEYYRSAEVMNHPPLAGSFFAAVARLAEATDLSFRILLRAPTALLDLCIALLLRSAFREHPRREAIFAAYWLSPLAALFSSYHGNTDTAVAAAVLAAVLLAGRGRPLLAGAALGAGVAVKLPTLIAAPAILLALPGWRDRMRVVAALAAVALLGYLPGAGDPALVFERVVGYAGSGVETARGIPIWGLAYTLSIEDTGVARWLQTHNTLVCLAPILLLAWLRRGRSSVAEIGAGVCGAYLLLYGLSSYWAWQYLAWSLPFWFFLGPRFAAPATLIIGAYVYGAYAVFTGSPWLQGPWDTVQHGPWPPILFWLRDASVLLCLLTGLWLLAREIRVVLAPPHTPGS